MRTWKLLAIAALAVSTQACVTESPVSLPDGTQGYVIHCNGAARSIGDCMNEAARVCGGKYTPIGTDSSTAGGTFIPFANGGGTVVQGVQRSLVVKCGG